jgi:hypothetical protein
MGTAREEQVTPNGVVSGRSHEKRRVQGVQARNTAFSESNYSKDSPFSAFSTSEAGGRK